jgi:predicted esterase
MKRLLLTAATVITLGAGAASGQTLASLNQQGLDPASGKAPAQLVVFFHGYGQKGEAMKPLAAALAARLPNAAFVFNNAPLTQGNGFSWYDFAGEKAAATRQSAQETSAALVASLSKTYNVSAQNIVTVGFSQGGGVAVMAGTCGGPDVKAIVSLAGVVPVACNKEGAAPASNVFIAWNEGDPTVRRERIDAGIATMKTAGYEPALEIFQGTTHWPAEAGLKAAENFIVAQLGGK